MYGSYENIDEYNPNKIHVVGNSCIVCGQRHLKLKEASLTT